MDIDALIGKVRGLKEGEKATPLAEYNITYDAFAETLEPIYFWILDFMQETSGPALGMEVEKLSDNFMASPGSGYFADMGARASRMQEQGMKILGTINTVMRSVLNLIYDLKEFEIRLEHYDRYKSKQEKEKEAGLLALKQIWMDKVDIKRGNGSINMLTAQLDFITLRDAFMRAKNPDGVEKLDLNERVKRILKPRLAEFLDWIERSERELRSRYDLQKVYLKSQVSSIKLYTRWVKPYLRAAEELMMQKREMSKAELVTAFDTIVLELSLFGKSKIDIKNVRKAIDAGNLPESFYNTKLRQNYYSCIFVDFSFRGLPRIASRGESTHYVHGGRAHLNFKAYTLNDDELSLLKKEIDKEEIYDGLRLVEGITSDSLIPIHDDLMKYIEKEKKKEEMPKKGFMEWLLGIKPKEAEEAKPKIRAETFIEKQIRKIIAEIDAKNSVYKLYDIYKKAHGMPTPLFKFVSAPGE